MILTVTPNPTIDRAVYVRGFRLGAVVRAEREVVTPSGKGIDASLVLHELGAPTVAIGLRAGDAGEILARLLARWGIAHDLVVAEGETRIATVLVDLDLGAQSTISAPSLRASEAHLMRLLEAIERHATGAWGAICAGSLAPGLPEDCHARIVDHCKRLGLYVLLDTSGSALLAGVGAHPQVLKLNVDEFAALAPGAAGLELGTDVQRSALAQRLLRCTEGWGVEALVLTVGAEGAVLVAGGEVYWATPPLVPVRNTAGAGDALGAGLMWGMRAGRAWPDALGLGTAAAASVVMHEGTAVCERAQVAELLAQVVVRRIDVDSGATSACLPLRGARTLLDVDVAEGHAR